jgi:acetyl esterase/lipase
MKNLLRSALLCLLALSPLVAATPTPAPAPKPPARPPATFADLPFGPHVNQRLDVYVPPKGSGPFPVLIWYGGIWKPARNVPDPHRFLPAGIALVAVGTRTLSDGMTDHQKEPVAYLMDDACRAVQFVRAHAKEWNLNPDRIAVGGGSQGALPALYVGCSVDRANPTAADPVERASSKVTCVAAYRSQPSIDPLQMQTWVPGVQWGTPALGYASFPETLKRREELLPIINRWSPDKLLRAESAPIYFENNWGLTQPDKVSEADYKVHSPAWSLGFQKLAEAAGTTCFVKYPDHPTEGYDDIWDFIKKRLTTR